MMQFIQSYFTDIGTKRKTNQDSLALLKAETEQGEVLLAVMCDGMGGHQYGELASKVCVKRFEKWFKTRLPYLLYENFCFENLKSDWKRLVTECNNLLVDYGQKNQMELGSTLTAALLFEGRYYAVHVGDSRCYKILDEAVQITRDHSLLESEIEKGILTREEAKTDKRKNVLLECVGITRKVSMDFYSGTAEPDAGFLLCTDGLWKRLEDEEIKRYLCGRQIRDNKMLRMHLNFLVETVKARGEKDNISAIGIAVR